MPSAGHKTPNQVMLKTVRKMISVIMEVRQVLELSLCFKSIETSPSTPCASVHEVGSQWQQEKPCVTLGGDTIIGYIINTYPKGMATTHQGLRQIGNLFRTTWSYQGYQTRTITFATL